MIVPAGLPFWKRSRSIEDLGGHANKRDYGNLGPVDYLTDTSAAQLCRLAADVASMSIVAPIMTIRILATTRTASHVFQVTTIQSSIGLALDAASAYYGDTPPTGYPSVINCSGESGSHTGTNGYTIRLILPDTATTHFAETATVRARFVFSASAVAYMFDGVEGAPVAMVREFELDTELADTEYADLVVV